MAQSTWTRKKREKRQREEQDRHATRQARRHAEVMGRGLESGDREDAEAHADELLARTRRVKDGHRKSVQETRLGRVISYKRNRFLVDLGGGKLEQAISRSTTKTPHQDATLVAVGDQVQLAKGEKGLWLIDEVLERKNRLSRGSALHKKVEQVIVSNVDQLVIVASVRDPYLKPGLIDRYLVSAASHSMGVLICFNKVDLDTDGEWKEIAAVYSDLGFPTVGTSATTGEGVEALQGLLRDKVSVMSGQSGVGKSSLLNTIDPDLELPVALVMQQARKGRHTTTASRLIPFAFGGYVADTPGIKEFTLWGVEAARISTYYPEFASLEQECRFRNCTHAHEPDCAVLAALEEGNICEWRYRNYLQIVESIDESHA
jgi:ribosome biogenesis GTPase / thiamine phosphate phosphatase